MRVGAYELQEVLGRGATGKVWKATYQESTVAVKLLDKELSVEASQMLTREVHALASLTHPHIVTVLDFGHVSEAEASAELTAGQPFVVFEYASRGALDGYLATNPRLTWTWVRQLLFALLDGLAHAHARNVIHRDLKPANIIGFENPKTWKITDFGLAFLGGEQAKENRIFGTPHYMAPEQFHGNGYLYAPHTDLYALGVLAYQLVCGRLPFDHKSIIGLAHKHLSDPVPALQPIIACPPELEEWIGALLAKDVSSRFELAADAAASLREVPDDFNFSHHLHALGPEGVQTMETLQAAATQISTDTMGFGEGHALRIAEFGGRPNVAPQPPTWRRARVEFKNPLSGLSARLFSLRARELVGRDRELDQLWTTLVQVRRSGRVKRTLITGGEGSGKTALATWFSERAAETGAATVVVLGDDPWATMYRHARADEDPKLRAAFFGRIAKELDAEDLLPLWLSEGEVGETALISYLRAHGLRRPVVLVVDALQSSPLGLRVLDQLTRTDALIPHAVQVVATSSHTEDVFRRNEVQTVMRQAEVIELQNLPRLASSELLHQVLSFDVSTADRLHAISNGNPRTLFEVIEDWVDRRNLVETPDGFAVIDETISNRGESWRLRFDAVLAVPGHRDALIRAAVLGSQVNWGEWTYLCRSAGIAIADDLVSSLVRQSLAIWTEPGFTFAHGLMREVLLKDCDLVAISLEAAAALTELQGQRPVMARWGRIGEIYMAAGRFAEALDPLRLGAEDAARRAHLLESRRLCRLRLECAQEGTDTRATVTASVAYGVSKQKARDKDYPQFSEEIELARQHGWNDVLGAALLAGADTARLDRDFAKSLEFASQAMLAFDAAHDGKGAARALHIRADTLAYADRFAESYDDYFEAQNRYRALDHEAGIAWCDFGLGYIAQQWGDQEKALVHLVRAADWYRAHGHVTETASIENSIGDSMFQLGRFEEAVAFADSAIRHFMREGRHIPEGHANLALGLLALGDLERFKSEVVFVARNASHHAHFLTLYAGMAALDRDWDKWDELIGQMEASADYRRVDLAIGYDAMARCAEWVGAPDRVSQAKSLADAQWIKAGRVRTIHF